MGKSMTDKDKLDKGGVKASSWLLSTIETFPHDTFFCETSTKSQ